MIQKTIYGGFLLYLGVVLLAATANFRAGHVIILGLKVYAVAILFAFLFTLGARATDLLYHRIGATPIAERPDDGDRVGVGSRES